MADPAFDVHVMVDWSAASRPTRGADSIWAVATPTGRRGRQVLDRLTDVEATVPVNLATRSLAQRWLEPLVCSGARVLVGIDVPLGAPRGLVHRCVSGSATGHERSGGPMEPVGRPEHSAWRRWWALVCELVEDRADNANNRWHVGAELNRRLGLGAGPFWGCPPRIGVPGLSPTRTPITELAEFRYVEERLRAAGRRPLPLFQLAYAGSVGSQALMAIPRLSALERAARSAGVASAVWPFEPVPETSAAVVLAEIWPSALSIDWALHPVRDAAQVLHTAQRLVDADRRGVVAPWMSAGYREGLTSREITEVMSEEGWVLGVEPDGGLWPEIS